MDTGSSGSTGREWEEERLRSMQKSTLNAWRFATKLPTSQLIVYLSGQTDAKKLVVMGFCYKPSEQGVKNCVAFFRQLKEALQSGRLKILIGHGIGKAKTLLQLKMARNVNGKNKDLCRLY